MFVCFCHRSLFSVPFRRHLGLCCIYLFSTDIFRKYICRSDEPIYLHPPWSTPTPLLYHCWCKASSTEETKDPDADRSTCATKAKGQLSGPIHAKDILALVEKVISLCLWK